VAGTNGAGRRARARRRVVRSREARQRAETEWAPAGAPPSPPPAEDRASTAPAPEAGGEAGSLRTAHATLDVLEARLTAVTDALVRVSAAADALVRLVERELDGRDSGPTRWRHRAKPPAR
jgi:hypothetical protein